MQASAGVEANFNVDYAATRAALGGPAWDEALNFSLASYGTVWRRRLV